MAMHARHLTVQSAPVGQGDVDELGGGHVRYALGVEHSVAGHGHQVGTGTGPVQRVVAEGERRQRATGSFYLGPVLDRRVDHLGLVGVETETHRQQRIGELPHVEAVGCQRHQIVGLGRVVVEPHTEPSGEELPHRRGERGVERTGRQVVGGGHRQRFGEEARHRCLLPPLQRRLACHGIEPPGAVDAECSGVEVAFGPGLARMLESDGIAGPRGLGPWTVERWDDRGVDEVGELGERHRGGHLYVGAQIAPVAADDEVVARRQQGVEQLGPRLAARIAVAHHR